MEATSLTERKREGRVERLRRSERGYWVARPPSRGRAARRRVWREELSKPGGEMWTTITIIRENTHTHIHNFTYTQRLYLQCPSDQRREGQRAR